MRQVTDLRLYSTVEYRYKEYRYGILGNDFPPILRMSRKKQCIPFLRREYFSIERNFTPLIIRTENRLILHNTVAKSPLGYMSRKTVEENIAIMPTYYLISRNKGHNLKKINAAVPQRRLK